MLEISWKRLMEPAVRDGLVSLANNGQLPAKTAYAVGRLCKAADAQMKYIRDAKNETQKKFVILDKDSNPVLDEKRQVTYNSPTAQEEFKAAWDKQTEATVIQIKVNKLPFADIERAEGLSGLQIVALEDYIDGLPSEG